MAQFFLDASALVKRYVREAGTSRILELCEGDERLLVSRLSLVETTSAVVRRTNAGDIEPEHLPKLLLTLEDEFRTAFDVIELGGAVITRAVDLVRARNLRAADAIQLASALIARGDAASNQEITLVSSDKELNVAAEAEALRVLDPTLD